MQTVKLVATQITALQYHSLITEDAIKQYYDRQHAGKCNGDMYVLRIIRIIERGMWCKIPDTRYAGAQLAIKAEIEGITLPKDYVIASCEIRRVTPSTIAFTTPLIDGLCTVTDGLAFVQPKMKLPMRIESASYQTEKISVRASVFSHDWPWPVVAVLPPSGHQVDMSAKLADIKRTVDELLPNCSALFASIRPVADPTARPDAKQLTQLPTVGTMISLAEILDGTYYETPNKNSTIRLPANEAILYLSRIYISYCECFIQMTKDYPDVETVNAHRGLFKYILKSRPR